MESLILSPYQAQWEQDFRRIQNALQAALPKENICIEHVGSTAVKGLAAKPIIDVDISYPAHIPFAHIREGLVSIGYAHHGNQGIEDREVFKRLQTALPHAVLDVILHHLYVCPAHSEELRRHILFRNYLRTHQEARIEYEQLKQTIAAQAQNDRKMYAQLKEQAARTFVENILQQEQNQV